VAESKDEEGAGGEGEEVKGEEEGEAEKERLKEEKRKRKEKKRRKEEKKKGGLLGDLPSLEGMMNPKNNTPSKKEYVLERSISS